MTGLFDRMVMAWVGRAYEARSGLAREPAAVRIARLEALASGTPRRETPFYPDALPPTPTQTPVERRWGARIVDLQWPSLPDRWDPSVAEGYDRFAHNHQAHARLYQRGGRVLRIAIHGYGGGKWSVEQRMFPVRRWLSQGYDVALFALPFHGPRRAPGDKVRLPSSHPQVTVEGFRQAVTDLRALLMWARERYDRTGVMGMSLGGYTSALLGTVDDTADHLTMFIPLSSLSTYMQDHGRVPGTVDEQRRQRDLLDRVLEPVSPLMRAPVVAPEQVLVAGAVQDGITPIHHAEALAEHFGAQLIRFRGAHLWQRGRGVVFDAMERALPP